MSQCIHIGYDRNLSIISILILILKATEIIDFLVVPLTVFLSHTDLCAV